MSITKALKARRSILTGIGLVVLALFLNRQLSGLGKSKPVQSSFRKISVLTADAANEDIPIKITLSGKIEARNRVELFSEVSGILLTEHFREGMSYRKGDVLLRIDDTELRNSLLSMKSNLLNSVSQILPDLQLDFPDEAPGWQKFHGDIDFSGSLPGLPQVTNAKLKLFLSSRNIYSNYFNIKSQEARLAKYILRAPFTGVLSSADIQSGALVRSGQKLGTFIEPGVYELEASASMDDLRFIRIGDKVNLKSNDMDGQWTGQVLRINRSMDASTQTVKVYIGVSGSTLREGQYLIARIDGLTLNQVCRIPKSILLPGDKIYILEKDSILRYKELEIRYRGVEHVYASNVKAGERLVNQVVNNGHEGMIVQPINSASSKQNR